MKLKWVVTAVWPVRSRERTNSEWEVKTMELQSFVVESETDSVELEATGQKAWTVAVWQNVAVEFNIKHRSGKTKENKDYSFNTFKLKILTIEEDEEEPRDN